MPEPPSVDEWADVERTNWRTCFCCAVKNVAPCDVAVESGCCRKLVNFPLVVDDVDVDDDELVNFCTCFSATMFILDWAFNCCANELDKFDCSTNVDDILEDCRLWLRVLCDTFFVLTDTLTSDLSSAPSSPGAVTIYWGFSVSSTDIFLLVSLPPHKR